MQKSSSKKFPLNILYINPVSKMAGAEFSLLALIDGLDREKWNPMLLCPEDGMLPQLCRDRGVKVLFLPTLPRGGGSALETYKTLLPNAWKIKKFIQENRIQLVHSNNPRVAYHGGLGAKLAGVPSVMHVRDIENLPFSPIPKALLFNLICDRIIPVSFATKDVIMAHTKILAKKISVVHNGVKITKNCNNLQELRDLKIELGIKEQGSLLAMAGRITPSKGYEDVLRAFSLVVKKFDNTQLLIIGEAWKGDELYLKKLQVFSDISGHGNKVIFTGFRKDILQILNIVDVFLHCPVEPDPLPRVLLEASVKGKAIVAADTGGINEIILDGKTGLLVKAGDIEEIANAILLLLENPKWRKQLGQSAKMHIQNNFSIEKHVRSIEDIYDQLLRIN